MSLDHFIITVYVFVDDFLKESVGNLRTRGPSPKLTDAEVITMEIVGEYLGLGNDTRIWSYFKQNRLDWFPTMGDRSAFTRQCANLLSVKTLIHNTISQKFDDDLHMFDGLPIPTCHIKRYKRSKNLKGEGAVGYCAAKAQRYFGFKGHCLINSFGMIRKFSLTAGDVDERDAFPQTTTDIKGMVVADKGLIRPVLKEEMAWQDIDLQTPLKRNMKDGRPKAFVQQLVSTRRLVETVIGQLTDRFNIQRIRAKDMWHLAAKVGRKLLAHTVALLINMGLNPECPLQLERIVM